MSGSIRRSVVSLNLNLSCCGRAVTSDARGQRFESQLWRIAFSRKEGHKKKEETVSRFLKFMLTEQYELKENAPNLVVVLAVALAMKFLALFATNLIRV